MPGKQITNEQNQNFGANSQSLVDRMEYLHPRKYQEGEYLPTYNVACLPLNTSRLRFSLALARCVRSHKANKIESERTLLITVRNHWVLPLPTEQKNGQRMGSKQTWTTGRLLSNLKQC